MNGTMHPSDRLDPTQKRHYAPIPPTHTDGWKFGRRTAVGTLAEAEVAPALRAMQREQPGMARVMVCEAIPGGNDFRVLLTDWYTDRDLARVQRVVEASREASRPAS